MTNYTRLMHFIIAPLSAGGCLSACILNGILRVSFQLRCLAGKKKKTSVFVVLIGVLRSDSSPEVGFTLARGKYAALWGTCWLFMGSETDLKPMCDLLSLTCFTREHTRQRCIRSAKLLWILSSFVLVKCLVLETLADV